MRILDSQAPNIQIITNRPNDIHDKAAMDTHGKSQTHEHECHLVNIVTQGARPTNTNMALQPGTRGINDGVDQRIDKHVSTREPGFREMRDNHSTNGIRVHESGVEDERNEMVVQDNRLQVEICRDEGPCSCESEETVEGVTGVLAASATGFHDVVCAGNGAVDQYDTTVDHVPFVPGEVVDGVGDHGVRLDADGLEERALPETATADGGREAVDDAEGYDAFDGTGDYAEG